MLPPSFLPSLSVDVPERNVSNCAVKQRLALSLSGSTSLAGLSRRVCGMASTGGEAVLDVLDTLCLVGVREPVLAHIQVVAKANGAAGHEDLGY